MADPSPRVTHVPEDTPLSGCHVNGNGEASDEEPKEVPVPAVIADRDKENDPEAASSDADVAAATTNRAKAGSMQVAQAPPKKSGFVREFPRLGGNLMMTRSLHLFMFLSRLLDHYSISSLLIPCWH